MEEKKKEERGMGTWKRERKKERKEGHGGEEEGEDM